MSTPEDKEYDNTEFGDEITSDLTPFVYPTVDATPAAIPDKKWKPGDVVRLKSGGPLMTVDSYVPRFVPDYGARASSYAVCESGMKQAGEHVRCMFFSKQPDGHYSFGPNTMEINPEALTAVKGGTIDE